jgi:hypothetical protein
VCSSGMSFASYLINSHVVQHNSSHVAGSSLQGRGDRQAQDVGTPPASALYMLSAVAICLCILLLTSLPVLLLCCCCCRRNTTTGSCFACLRTLTFRSLSHTAAAAAAAASRTTGSCSGCPRTSTSRSLLAARSQ